MKKIPTKTEYSFALFGLIYLSLAAAFFFFHIFVLSPNHSNSSFSYLSTSPEALALPESLPGAAQLALGRKIDLNTATLQDFEALPGVGMAMAERIVKKRQELSRFSKLEDLMEVKGIKEKKYESLKKFIEVR